MGITGNISTMSLADVFQWLHGGSKTGTLHIESTDGIKKEVYFQDGYISSASSNDPQELIGQFLVNTQHITETQLADALESQKRDHNLLGKILVEQKVLSEEQLQDILRTISEEIIYDMFLWQEGIFEFKDELPDRDIPSFQLDITHLSLEGAQREDDWKRINQTFPDLEAIVRPKVEKIMAALPLNPGWAELLSHVNGKRTLAEINRQHGDVKYLTLSLMLDLHEEGLVEIGDFKNRIIPGTAKEKSSPVQEMIVTIQSEIEQGRLSEAEQLVRVLEQMGTDPSHLMFFKDKIKEKRNEKTAVQVFNPGSIPVLKMSVDAITKMDLSPEQGFLVSRINGVWDIKSIVKISPFGEKVCMDILKKFLADGVITLK